MAQNFFELSPTYRKETQPEVRARREVLARFLPHDFNVTVRDVHRIADSIASGTDKHFKESDIAYDVRVFRTAYLFFAGKPEDRQRIEELLKRNDYTIISLKKLIIDGINWQDIEKGKGSTTSTASEQSTPPPIPLQYVAPIEQPKEANDDHQGVEPETVEILKAQIAAFELKEKLTRDELSAELAALREEKDALATENHDLASRIIALEERIAELRVATLLKVAMEFPDIPKLLEIAEQARITEQARKRAVGSHDLPQKSVAYHDLPVVYEDGFLIRLKSLTYAEQEQVHKALELLTTHGSSYPSLQTHKPEDGVRVNGTPEGSSFSRASRELRFSWSIRGEGRSNALTVHNIYRRNELPYAER